MASVQAFKKLTIETGSTESLVMGITNGSAGDGLLVLTLDGVLCLVPVVNGSRSNALAQEIVRNLANLCVLVDGKESNALPLIPIVCIVLCGTIAGLHAG